MRRRTLSTAAALFFIGCGAGSTPSGSSATCTWPSAGADNSGCPAGGPGNVGAEPSTVDLGSGFSVRANLTYGTRGGRVLQGDLYAPPPSGNRPPGVLVVVHGGGWQDCARRRAAVAWYAQAVSRALRVATFNVEYRLSQEGAAYPEGAMDVKCAIQWIAGAAAGFGLDGSRVAVAGESAGGHLAALMAVTAGRGDLDPHCSAQPARVAAAISYSGPMDLPRLVTSPSLGRGAVLRYAEPCSVPVGPCDRGRSCDRCVDASPIAHACDASGRIVLVQAPDAFDSLVPLAQAQGMRQALEAAGAGVDLVVPSAAELEAEGCRPNDFLRQAHGLGNTCLTTPSGALVARVLLAAIGP